MADHFDLDLFYQAEANDADISFNIQRKTFSNNSRRVTVYPDSRDQKLIFPGVNSKAEKELIDEIKEKQKWQFVERHGFKIKPRLYSFLWRRLYGEKARMPVLRVTGALPAKIAKTVRKKWQSYMEYLGSALAPGNIFLVPDSMVGFGSAKRKARAYARPALIYRIDREKSLVYFIPFSSELTWMDKKRDLLFDASHPGPALVDDDVPSVENFPYEFSTNKKVALRISVPDVISMERFLDSALQPVGALRPQALDFVKSRLLK